MSPSLLTMAPNHLDMLAHQHQHSPATARPAGLSGMTVTPMEAMEKAKHAVASSQHRFPEHHPQQLHHPEPNNNKKGKKKDSGAQLNADGEMIIVDKPGQHDVLLGRGGGTNNHGGNIRFRKLVNEHKLRYLAANKVEKPNVARDVVDIWRNLQPSGRFLARYTDGDKTEKNGPGGVKQAESLWYEVGDKRAREKASQCLRERTPEVMPYIKKIREQQDALTEEGMAIFQAQQAAQAGIKIPPFHSSNGKTRRQRGLEDISERSAPGRLDNSYAFGGGAGNGNVRRNPMPSVPDAAGSGSDPHAATLFRRSSDVTGGVRPSNAAALNSRRSSLPANMAGAPASVPSSSAFAQQQTHNIEESLYSNAAEMDYYQRCNSLLMMQQQQIEDQMLEYRMLQEQQSRYAAAAGISPRQMQLHQQQLQMRHRANGGIPASPPKGRGHPVHYDDVEPHDHQDYFSPLPLEGEGEGAAAAAAAAAAGNRKAGRSCLKKGSSTAVTPNSNSNSGGFKRSRTAEEMAAAALAAATGGKDRRSSGITSPTGPEVDNNSKPETTTSAAVDVKPAPVADPVDEEGEMTIEEYRRQLEEYMNKQNALDGGNQGMDDDGNDSDLEDDWEKEKEKAHREHQERNDTPKKRGVKSALSGCSFMSTETFKSNMSMLSGMSMLSEGDDGENLDAILSQDREKKMGVARSVSSNLSLMSELTDMSQNLDELHL